MRTKELLKYAIAASALGVAVTSCSDDDEVTLPTVNPATAKFIVVSGDPETDLTGGVYMKVFSDLATVKTGQTVYGDDVNGVKCPDGFTQETYNSETGIFTGYIYARAASAEGIGSLKTGLRSYKIVNDKLTEVGEPQYISNFGNTGCFGTYSYAAQISNPVIARIDNSGKSTEFTIDPTKYAIDGINPAVSNIIDRGNNQIAIVLTYSNRDSAVVALADYGFNITKVIATNSIGTSVGAQRSVRYTQSGVDDNGNVYVFSGSSDDGGKVGAVRINKGESDFDASYKFDILTKSGGYRFRKVFHITDDKFLVEFYLTTDKYGNMDASGKMAVVDMSEKSVTWVDGLPDPSTVSIAWGDSYDGSYYLPVAAATSFGGGSGSGGGRPQSVKAAGSTSVTPTIYKIEADTGVATAFMTFGSGDLLKAIRIIK